MVRKIAAIKSCRVKHGKKAQVWVETVIYTLIGLAVIGILLSIAKPKIESMKDKLLIEQTIDSLNKVNNQIFDVQIAPGNKRILNLKISEGNFYVNASGNQIGWILDSDYKYSEIDRVVSLGNLYVLTQESSPYLITITMNYSVNLTYQNFDSSDKILFQGSPVPYVLSLENKGLDPSSVTNIDLSIS